MTVGQLLAYLSQFDAGQTVGVAFRGGSGGPHYSLDLRDNYGVLDFIGRDYSADPLLIVGGCENANKATG